MRSAFVVLWSMLGFGCFVYAGVLTGHPVSFVPQHGTPPATGGAIGFGIGGGLCVLAAAVVLASRGHPATRSGQAESGAATDGGA